MSNMSNLNDQQNLTLTQISYCSNMLAKHHGKSFGDIMAYVSNIDPDDRTEEESRFYNLMNQFPEGENPYEDYIIKSTDNNSSSGFGAVAFTDDKGNTGISYRGTDGVPSKKSMNDWFDNVVSGLTGDSQQCREAEAFFKRNSDPDGNNYLYGHSKGGNLSEYVYVKYHEKINGVHLLNPQPLNPWSLSPGELAAMQSDKVDIVIVEGDYVWFIGMLPSYGNVRVVDSNGGDSHSYWSINFTNGSVSKGSQPWWEYLAYYGVTLLSPFLQLPGAVFGFFCDCVCQTVSLLKTGWEKCKEIGAWICDKVKAMGNKFKEFAEGLGDFFGKLISKGKSWYNNNLNAGYKYASANPQIIVDTYKLKNYGNRLQKVNSRIAKLDRRMDSLYGKVGLLDLWNLIQADLLTGYSWRLKRCVSYLEETARDFENAEKSLMNEL